MTLIVLRGGERKERKKERKKETAKGWVLITRYVVKKEAGLTSFVDQSKKEWEL